jgi:transketolase C-terminal domain/subunit
MPVPAMHAEEYRSKLGERQLLRQGRDVSIIAAGTMVAPGPPGG